MVESFRYDVVLSHSVKDKAAVRSIAERLRADGLRVWLEEWEIRPDEDPDARIEDGLEHSRVLVLCISAQVSPAEWAPMEAGTLRFRDPQNAERRFIPLRLDNAPVRGTLAPFSFIDWHTEGNDEHYPKLLAACRPPLARSAAKQHGGDTRIDVRVISLGHTAAIRSVAFSPDGRFALLGSDDRTARIWDTHSGQCLRVLEGHSGRVYSVAWSHDGRFGISGAGDGTARVWDAHSGHCLRVLEGYSGPVTSVAWSPDGRLAVSGAHDTARVWDAHSGHCLRVLEGHSGTVYSVAWSPDGRLAISGATDDTARVWDPNSGQCLRVLEGHLGTVYSVAWSPDGRLAISGAEDGTARVWDAHSGHCLRVLEGHSGPVYSVAWSPDGRLAISGAHDGTARVWDPHSGQCLRVLEGHSGPVTSVALSAEGDFAFSSASNGVMRVWTLRDVASYPDTGHPSASPEPAAPEQRQYTNAKVLLVGDSGAGKTGLARRLAQGGWEPSDSTVGAWATHWKLPATCGDGVDREVWLWDFGGQADQRLIHQLYMDETALAVLVFDGQKDDVLETLGQWDRDLTRASRREFAKLLVAGRVDAGGLRVGRGQVDSFVRERGYARFLETSAKADIGCEELKQAILEGICWEGIPWRSSPLLFTRLKEEIIRLKDEGRVLLRFNELRETLQLRLSGEGLRFSDDELRTVVGLLTGPGAVWELKFGSWVLLQPERINAYAQVVIHTMRGDAHERGCLAEERVLNGDLAYHSFIERLHRDDERFVLLAMHQVLVERGLCLREPTEKGTVLVFPSFYRRERPDLVGHPAVHVSYRFHGFLDDVYATLVVRLHHATPFEQAELWRYAADFTTLAGKTLGVKLTRRAEGAGELDVYFDPSIDDGEKIVFSKYVHEHLLQYGKDVVRLRHYVCPHCGTPVGNREVAMKRLEGWLQGPAKAGKSEPPTIVCVQCEDRVPLWDDIEQSFASAEVRHRVRELQKHAAIVLDSESKDRTLVGEVISTVALAGQISREFTVSDHGIDMEIEFKDDDGRATACKLYLQLKSGDSHLRKRKSDGAEIFTIEKERHASYWRDQAFPVLLVVRSSEGEVRWMEVRDWLKRESDGGKRPVKQIVFTGERFDVMSVRRWRDRALADSSAR